MPPENKAAALPLLINWNITYRCNYYCAHCYSREETDNKSDSHTRRQILQKLIDYRIPFVNLGGGEPLLLHDLFDLVALAVENGLKLTLSSNGSMIDAALALKIKQSGLVKVEISLDGASASSYQKLRNTAAGFARTISAIEHLRNSGNVVDISTVVNRWNWQELGEVIALARKMGVRKISFHNYKCSGNGYLNRDELDLTPSQWREFYQWILPLKESENGVIISVDDPITAALQLPQQEKTVIKGSSCGKLSLRIKADGEITPCGFIPKGIGNILTDDLKDIWDNSELLLKMRGKRPQGKCVSCKHYTDCLGGCTARALAVGGDVNAPDPHCWIE